MNVLTLVVPVRGEEDGDNEGRKGTGHEETPEPPFPRFERVGGLEGQFPDEEEDLDEGEDENEAPHDLHFSPRGAVTVLGTQFLFSRPKLE